MKIWYLYALMTVVLWGVWGVFSKLSAAHSRPRQMLLFQSVGVLAFALDPTRRHLGAPQWLRQVDTIVGELHGTYDWDRLAADLAPCGFQIERRAKLRSRLFCARQSASPVSQDRAE